jgi:hypothetical protein
LLKLEIDNLNFIIQNLNTFISNSFQKNFIPNFNENINFENEKNNEKNDEKNDEKNNEKNEKNKNEEIQKIKEENVDIKIKVIIQN